MGDSINDATIEYICALAGLELSLEERAQAKQDMARMLEHIDRLKELDTSGVEPLCHVMPLQNILREDVVTNGDESQALLQNAPCCKDGMFIAPRTF